MDGRREDWVRGLGLLLPVLLWTASIAALLQGMRANEAAGLTAGRHGVQNLGAEVRHLHGLAVMWCVAMAGLQLGAGLLGALLLRAMYRMRTAVCFAVSGGSVILLNVLWLLGLLVWLRAYGEAR